MSFLKKKQEKEPFLPPTDLSFSSFQTLGGTVRFVLEQFLNFNSKWKHTRMLKEPLDMKALCHLNIFRNKSVMDKESK